jgi:hypothetical protein
MCDSARSQGALRQGVTLQTLANWRRAPAEHIARMLGLQSLQPVPTDEEDQDFDLFALDRLPLLS